MMLQLRYILLVQVMVLAAVGCITAPKSQPLTTNDQEIIREFSRGNDLMTKGEYAAAAQLFDSLMVERHATEVDLIIVYNAASSYEAMGQCRQAGTRYRQVARGAAKKFQYLAALSLYRVGQMHMCLGQAEKALASYLDSWSRRQHLPLALASAELPARVATAYAILGNTEQAKKYFDISQKGLLQLQSQKFSGQQKAEILAKALYFMGQIDDLDPEVNSYKVYLKTLGDLQVYALKAVELTKEPWSTRSAAQIRIGYENVWSIIGSLEQTKSGKGELEIREVQKQQNWLVEEALANIEKLKAAQYPEDQNLPEVKKLMLQMDENKKRFKAYLSSGVLGNSLTEAAKRKQALKREGRVFNPDPILEEHAHRRSTVLPEKKMPAVENANP